jgi:hypothetical protein
MSRCFCASDHDSCTTNYRCFNRFTMAFSLFCSKRSRFSSKRIARSANAFSAAFANFWTESLHGLSSSPHWAILLSTCLRKGIKPLEVVGVTSFCVSTVSKCLFSVSVFTGLTSTPGFWIPFSTLCELYGRSPDLDQADVMFQKLNSLHRAPS